MTLYSLAEPKPNLANPCEPTPCGPYSQCKETNGQATCSCLLTYIGVPPNCKPECTVSSDCSLNLACKNNKCIDPCSDSCGQQSTCRVVNHSPICSCKPGFTGDPFTYCFYNPRKLWIIFFRISFQYL